MDRICRKCGSDNLRGTGYINLRAPRWEDQSTMIYTFECRRCGARSGYGDLERTRFTVPIINRAVALDNTV